MQTVDSNPRLSNYLRAFLIVVDLVVLFGSGLLLLPDLVRPRWPWPIAPFNSAFLGTIYLTELILLTVPILVNHWSPNRLVIVMALVFVTVVSGVNLFYLDYFNYTKVATYAWYVAYFGSIPVLAYFLSRYRRLPPANPNPPSRVWQIYLAGQGLTLLLYGLALLAFPATFAAYWPWKIDNFHGQVYSAVFISGGIGCLILVRAAHRLEFLTLGLTQLSLGLFSIAGLAIVDASQHRVGWSATGTWVWLIGFGVMALSGAAMIWEARAERVVLVAKLES